MGDRIACGYHGVQVSGDGTVMLVPGAPGSKLEGKKCVRSFPTEERHGAIFAYAGDALHPEPIELQFPEQLASPEFSSFLCYCEWEGDYRYVYDNVMDPMHGTFLHKQSHSMSFGDTTANFQVRETPTGFVFEKEGQRNVNFDWTEFLDTGAHWLRLEIPYPKTGGPGGNFHIVGVYTPIDRDARRASSTGAAARSTAGSATPGASSTRTGWRRGTGTCWSRTACMLEQFEPDANQRENLYQHDMGVARLRRVFRTKAEAQLKALEAAGLPVQ